MATIDYKEKYEKAVQAAMLAKQDTEAAVTIGILEEIFPELKESEDERIRKVLVDYFKRYKEQEECGIKTFFGIPTDNIIAWLEKKGEQNPYSGVSFKYNGHTWGMCARDNGVEILVDGEIKERVFLGSKPQGKSALEAINEEKVDNANKVEPKFKVGDWISGYYTNYKVLSVNNDGYLVEDVDGNKINILFENEKFHHLFTIADAKDGDVLATLDYILIFKKMLSKDGGVSYCHYDFGCSTPHFNFNEDANWYFGKEAKVYPATKEQYDLLFQKMKEAGYDWDAERKELKKVELKPILDVEIPFGTDSELVEETITIPDGCYAIIEDNKVILRKGEKKFSWSEEDEKHFDFVISHLKLVADEKAFAKEFDWVNNRLKSLRPQNRWKPSDKQMEVLNTISNKEILSGYESGMLIGLYTELQKLREE